MLVKSTYPESSNLQIQNPELPVIWSEPDCGGYFKTAAGDFKPLVVSVL